MSTTILGLILIILSQFVPAEEAQTVISAVGILISWWGRVRIGDVTPLGLRK